MGWGKRTHEGRRLERNRVRMSERPGVIAVVSGDRSTYPQFASAVTFAQGTPGTRLLWRLSGGGGVAAARNRLVREALESFDGRPGWVWFVDDDHVFAPDILRGMLARDKDLLVPMVSFRYPPFGLLAWPYFDVQPEMTDHELIAVWKAHRDCVQPTARDHGLLEIGHAGTPGLLISTEVLQTMPDPWFEFGRYGAEVAGEDNWFCLKARRLGFDIFLDLDARMAHLNTCAVWPHRDPQTGTVEPLMQFDSMSPEIEPNAFTVGAYVDPLWLSLSDAQFVDDDDDAEGDTIGIDVAS